MQSSKYAQKVPVIVADMERERQEYERARHPDQDAERQTILYVYPITIGGVEGVLHTKQEVAPEFFTETIDAQESAMDTRSAINRQPPYFLHFLLILFLFVGLDTVDSFFTMLAPVVTVTITPQVKTITLASSMQLGKLLSPITLSESQTVPATGHGHQIATRATGSVTFYNGLFTHQFIVQGTVFTGNDGVQIVTDESVTIPANSPPVDGQASVTAHALDEGAKGNMNAGDVDTTINNGLLVRNSPFSGGQDERNFSMVTKADTNTAALALKAKVTASMTAALQGQLMPRESIQPTPCTPTTTADHGVGEEATHVTVSVSETCNAIAYNTQELSTQATRLLTTQAAKKFGQGYTVSGNIQVTITKAITHQKTGVLLSFTTQGTYVYQLTPMAQARIVTLVAGKPRQAALHQLATLPGVSHISISGIPDNQPLPDDLTHIHLLIMVEGERTWAIQQP